MSRDTALTVALARLDYDRAKRVLRALYRASAGTVAVASQRLQIATERLRAAEAQALIKRGAA